MTQEQRNHIIAVVVMAAVVFVLLALFGVVTQ